MISQFLELYMWFNVVLLSVNGLMVAQGLHKGFDDCTNYVDHCDCQVYHI